MEEAYLHPEVDSDPSNFEWGVPDLDALRTFLMTTIGWSKERTDEILLPVIRDMNRRQVEGTQANLTDFFNGTSGVGAYAPRRGKEVKSKRLNTALLSLKDQAERRKVHDQAASSSRSRQKRKATQREVITVEDDEPASLESTGTSSGEDEVVVARKKGKGSKAGGKVKKEKGLVPRKKKTKA